MIGLLANLARQLPKAVKAVTSKSQQQTPMGPQPAPQTQRAPTPSLSQIVQNLGPQGFSQPRPQQTPQQPLPQMSGISQMPAAQVGTAIRQSQIPNQQNLLAELASAQRNLQSQQVSSQVPEKPGLRGLIGSLVQMSPSFNYQSPGQVLKSAPKDFMQPVATGTLKGFINSMIGIGESFQSASLAMTPWLNQQQKQGVRDLQGQRFESTSPAEGTAMFVGSVAPEVMAGNVAAATLPLRAGQGFQLGRRLQQGAAATGAEIGTQALTGETDNLVGDTALATAANMLFPVRQAPSPGQIAGEVPTPQQAARALPDKAPITPVARQVDDLPTQPTPRDLPETAPRSPDVEVLDSRKNVIDEMPEVQIAPPKKTKKVKKTMKDLARISDENYMQAIPDKDIGYYTRFFGSANRIIEDFFGKEGAKRWQNTIGESISKARKTFSDEWKARNSQIKEIIKEYKITKKNQKDAAEFAEGNMTKADLIKKYGDKQADLIELAAKAARRLYDEGIKKLNEAEKLAGIPITKPRKDYVRHAHEMSSPAFSTWTDGIFTSRVRKGTMRPPSGKTGGESITKRRGNQSEALGLIDGLRDWNNQASKIIGFAQARKHVDDFLKFMRTTKPKGHSHTYAEMYDNFYGWLKGYSRELAGKPRNIDPLADSIRNSSVGRAIATVDSKLKGSMILGNLSSTFMNFANLPQILSALDKGIPGAGLKKLSGAVKAMFTPEGKKALADSGWIQERYLYKESGASLNKAGSEFSRALQVFTGVGDEITVKASYLARLKDNLNEGMDYRAAVREAEEFTEKMVGGRGTAEYPELLGHPLGRLFLPFNREVVNLGEIVMKDLPKKVQENALEGAMGIVLLSGYLWLFNNAQEQIFNRRSLVDPIDLISDVAREIDRPSTTPLIARIGGRTANEALSLTPFSSTVQQLLNGLSREQKDEIFGKERFEGGFLLSRIFTTGLNALSELSDVANGDKEMSDLVTGDLARLMLMFVDSGGQIYKGLQMADVAANEGVVTNRGGDEIGRVESIFDMIRGFAGGPSSVQSVSDYYKKGEDPETFGFREREIERTETKKQKDKFLQEMYKLRKEDNREEFGKKLNENVDPSLQSEFFKDLDKFIEKQEVGRIDNVGRKLRGNLPAKQKAEALMEIGVQIGEEAFKQRVAEYDRQGLITPAVEKELMPLILQTFN